MTTSEICVEARQMGPKIQLRDIWLILREMEARGLVNCLNARHVTGKLYALTLRGRRTVKEAFRIHVSRPPNDVDWRKYARVSRAKVRRLILQQLSGLLPGIAATATAIRKGLREHHPLGLNPTIRALKELEQLGLLRSSLISNRDCRKRYRLSKSGAAVVQQIHI
jgi:DNA-binding PadR family transcriptional regulator